MQDVRLNGNLMEFYPMSDLPDDLAVKAVPLVITGLVSGEVSEDMCHATGPCVNEGTCEPLFYNDYRYGYKHRYLRQVYF